MRSTNYPAILAPLDGTSITKGAYCDPVRPYRVCVRCVMDTTDPEISFDDKGVCSHCLNFEERIRPYWPTGPVAERQLSQMISNIRSTGSNSSYDCIIGVSGGVDSSFLVAKAAEWGLKPLVVHVDAGWNSELAVSNIEKLCSSVGVELHTVVVNWPQMRDLQVAFLKSHLANQDVPQDHAFFAALYQFALKEGVKTVLTGSNFATESILPRAWGYNAMDARHLKAVHNRWGSVDLDGFPIVSPFQFYFGFKYINRMKIISPLNFIEYSKSMAIAHLEKNYGWRYYGGKHYESRWTKFFQSYYLPYKFGYDKRKAHLSSLVVAGEITRAEALRHLSGPLVKEHELAEDLRFIERKLQLGPGELQRLIEGPVDHYSSYRNSEKMLRPAIVAVRTARRVSSLLRSGGRD